MRGDVIVGIDLGSVRSRVAWMGDDGPTLLADAPSTGDRADVLAKLRKAAEARLGRSVRDAVFAVPAAHAGDKRGALAEAGHDAGLDVLSIIDDPKLAISACGVIGTVLVVDVGGWLDVTVLRTRGDRVETLSTGRHATDGTDLGRRCADATASVAWSDLDYVLLVGGRADDPAVREALCKHWRGPVDRRDDRCVAYGAALEGVRRHRRA